MHATSTRNSGNARTIVGSIGVLGAAVAVAGLGTFGSFTDSTAPVATEISTGTVSINVTQQGATIPVTTANFVAGDSISRAVDLVNDGTAALSRISLASTASASNALSTDATNGLQLSVRTCTAPWTQGGTAEAPTYTCPGSAYTLYSGPAVMDSALAGVSSVQAGGVDHLLLNISLPASAGNTLMGLSNTLGLTFTGVQRDGGAR